MRKLGMLFLIAVLVSTVPTASAESSMLVSDPKHPNFGAVRVGETKALTITISNTTTSTIYFPTFALDGVDFPLDFAYADFSDTCFVDPTGEWLTPVLPGGSSCDIQIAFSPSSVGRIKGTLTVYYYTNPNQLRPCCFITLKLKGKGIQAVR